MMKWLVGFVAIVIIIAVIALAVSLLGEAGFFLIVFVGVIIFIAPTIGEMIIDWYKERRFSRKKHSLPDALSMVTDHDLEIMRKHTHNE